MIIYRPKRQTIEGVMCSIPIGPAALARSGGDASEQPAAGKLVLQVSIKFLSRHPLGYLTLHALALLLFLCSFSLLEFEAKEMTHELETLDVH